MKRSPIPCLTLAGAILAALVVALAPSAPAAATGPIWLPAERATHASFNNLQLIVATYRDHAYVLSAPATRLTIGDRGGPPARASRHNAAWRSTM